MCLTLVVRGARTANQRVTALINSVARSLLYIILTVGVLLLVGEFLDDVFLAFMLVCLVWIYEIYALIACVAVRACVRVRVRACVCVVRAWISDGWLCCWPMFSPQCR